MDSDASSDNDNENHLEIANNGESSEESESENIESKYLNPEQFGNLIKSESEESTDDEENITPKVADSLVKKIIPSDEKKVLNFLIRIDNILLHYQILRPLFQDVTPSFADEVPFLVDGDSLMITIMMDKNWSSQLGGSSLHLVYLFERYLNIFVQRGGAFHIVFFQNWRNIWHTNWNILLHRSVLINHFSRNTEKYPVHLFDHCFDENFVSLVSTLRPGFILTNMDTYDNCSGLEFFKIKSDLLIHIMNINLLNWLKMDLPCIDTNFIEVDVSIVRGCYLECNSDVREIVNQHLNKFIFFITNLPKIEECLELPDSINISEDYDIRTATYLIAAYFFYKRNNDENMVKIFFITFAMMEFLELKNRCCPKLTSPLLDLEKIITEWHKCMFFAISELENRNYNYTAVSDMWQGILFGHVCRFVSPSIDSSEKLGSEVGNIYEKMVQDFNSFGFSINAYPVALSDCDISFESLDSLTISQEDPKPLIPVQNQLVFAFCNDILHNIKWCDPPKKIAKKEYTEEHHYHNMQVITDEHDHIKDNIMKKPSNDWEQMKYIKNRNLQAKYMTLYGSSIEGRPLVTSAVIRNSNISSKGKKKNRKSAKAQELIDANIRKKKLEQEKKDKKQYDELKQKYDYNADLETLLGHVNLVLMNKTFCEGSYKIKTLFLKLKIMRSISKYNKKSQKDEDKKETQKTIFLIARDILNSGSALPLKKKELLSECFSNMNCNEIAKRNNLPVHEEPSSEDDAWIRFQFDVLGPELIRETGGISDSRVNGFIPDPWQSELFDIVDSRQSALIVAPTSSGKTYASYYCMESVLKEGTEGVVVYVAPTKALVNQVAATVYARFKDTIMPEGMSVYGVFTRDYRMYALTSQVLITVPQCLEILLLSPRRHAWVKRLRYVIFDEIHCIEGNLGGASFERCLLLIRCPFLALSATIRNPHGLHMWLKTAENYKQDRDLVDGFPRENNSYKVHLVVYTDRHSDLVKFTYGNGKLHHLHPYAELEASVMRQHKGIPSHMTLSPAETMQLYDTMHKVYPESDKLKQLSPVVYFSTKPDNGFIGRNAVREYASELSALLEFWYENHNNCFNRTIRILKPIEIDQIYGSGRFYIMDNITKLILNLKEQNMLPALVFAYNRSLIVDMTRVMTNYLEANKRGRSSKTNYIREQKEYRPMIKLVEDRLETKKYKIKALSSFSGNAAENEMRISSNRDYIDKKNLRKKTAKPTFCRNYDKPLYLISEDAGQSLQGVGVMDSEDIKFMEQRLRRSNVNSKSLIANAMRNGVCVHHGGLNNKIRSAVEMLYRKKFLNVVFATGTLALGIHMPCKTAVIAGNSAFLNSLEYHQMSGRAGRRGYDTVGNVVFLGLNSRKQHSLLTAKLPYLKGNFPVTVSLILRTLLLVSDVTDKGKQSEEATKISVSRVLSMFENSLCFMENPDLKIIIKHFFSFTLQLLRIQGFINDNGEPLKWCGLATHLHYHEPGNLAFVYLLKTGVIRKICQSSKNDKDVQDILMIILSHLFTRVPLDAVTKEKIIKKKLLNSKVVLNPLPKIIVKALEQYNDQVSFVFNQYFANVANHFNDPDNILPLSSVKIIGKNCSTHFGEENLQNKFMNMCVPKLVCSSFAALSGNNDDKAYTEDTLISNLKQKMATEVKVIPLINLNAELNGYAVDFYEHGIVKSIIIDNGIKEGFQFALLTDFLLVLKTIRVSLEEMKIKNENDIVFHHFHSLEQRFMEHHSKEFGGERI